MKRSHLGKFRHKIGIYVSAGGKTATGAVISNAYSLQITPWAAVELLGTSDTESGEKSQIETRYKIQIRRRVITNDSLISWRNQLFKIVSVDDSDPQGRYLFITAKTENGVLEKQLSDAENPESAIYILT